LTFVDAEDFARAKAKIAELVAWLAGQFERRDQQYDAVIATLLHKVIRPDDRFAAPLNSGVSRRLNEVFGVLARSGLYVGLSELEQQIKNILQEDAES
jgi:hypothetical protein